MKDKYIFELDNTTDACILSIKNKKTSSLESYFKLKEHTRITDINIYDEDCFYLLGDDSTLYFGEVGLTGLDEVLEEQGLLTPGYYFDKNAKELYLAFEKEDEEKFVLQRWNLLEKKCTKELELPFNIDFGTLTKRSDGCFLFYQNSKRDLKHGFYCVDKNLDEISYQALQDKLQGIKLDYTSKALFPHNKDIAILPVCDEFLTSKDKQGDTLYHYQLQFIDLNDISTSWRKTVHKFKLEDFCHEDYERSRKIKKMRKLENDLQILVDENKDFKDAECKEDFIERYLDILDDMLIYDEEDALWLKWNGELIFSKIDLEGNNISPLYHLKDESGLNVGFFNKTQKAKQKEAELIKNTLQAAKAIQEDGKTILIIEAVKTKELNIPDSYHSMAKQNGVNLIEVDDLYMEGKNEALSILVQKMQ